jgi:cation/acetate symporter
MAAFHARLLGETGDEQTLHAREERVRAGGFRQAAAIQQLDAAERVAELHPALVQHAVRSDERDVERIEVLDRGRVQYVASAAANELAIDQDIMVLANPEIAGLPSWVVGLVAAGGLAAALSTAAGLLLVVSTSISHDLLKRALLPQISERGELLAARTAAALAVIVAGWLGIHPPGFVGQVVAFAFGLAASSFFPAIVMGIFSRRMNREGAIAGMATGLAFTAGYILWFKFIARESSTPEHWLFGISPEGIGALGMLLNFAVACLVARLTPAPPREIQALIDAVRVPRAATAPAPRGPRP